MSSVINIPRDETVRKIAQSLETLAERTMIVGSSNVVTDSSLTKSNAAADSKAVGDRIAEVSASVDKVKEAIALLDESHLKGKFIIGRYVLSATDTAYVDYQANTYVVCSANVIKYSYDVTLEVEDGYEATVWYVKDSELPIPDIDGKNKKLYVKAEQVTAKPVTIPANTAFLVRIQQTPLDKTVAADVETYTSKVKFTVSLPKQINSVADSVNAVSERVRVIEDGIGETLPEYYLTDGYIDGRIDEIRRSMQSAGMNGDAFVFLTDFHSERNNGVSPTLVNYITKRLPIACVFCGGDWIDLNTADSQAELDLLFEKCMAFCGNRYKTYFTEGNHDDNNYDGTNAAGQFTRGNIYASLFRMSEGMREGWNGDCFSYYTDNTDAKIRYIVLDTENRTTAELTGERAWFKSVLESMPDGYRAVCFSHRGYVYDEEVKSWTLHAAAKPLIDEADAHSGMVAAWFTGHSHMDGLNRTTSGIPVICTLSDGATQVGLGGTTAEQAFDVAVIDFDEEKIHLTRIGSGDDRTIALNA